jgi:hypothetical protein
MLPAWPVVEDQAIKVGFIAEQTGPLSFMGIANANVAKIVVNDINAAGGLLGGSSISALPGRSRDHRRRAILRRALNLPHAKRAAYRQATR